MIKLNSAEHQYDSVTKVVLPDLKIEAKSERVILGLSGSGKSTLLHILAGILKPTKGTLEIDGKSVYNMTEAERDRFRGQHIGIIFQQLHLVDSLTVRQNLRLAQYMAGRNEPSDKIQAICNQLEISEKLDVYADQLSQGQKQRVGIARAVINEPLLILADEPTSSLDDRRAEDVIRLLRTQAEQCGATLIISTHDNRVKQYFEQTVNLDEIQTAGGVV